VKVAIWYCMVSIIFISFFSNAMQNYLAIKDTDFIKNPSSIFYTIIQTPTSEMLKSQMLRNNLAHVIKTNVHMHIGDKNFTIIQVLDTITNSFLSCDAYMKEPSSHHLFFNDQCEIMKLVLHNYPDLKKEFHVSRLYVNI
jgi:hypothetical protein